MFLKHEIWPITTHAAGARRDQLPLQEFHNRHPAAMNEPYLEAAQTRDFSEFRQKTIKLMNSTPG